MSKDQDLKKYLYQNAGLMKNVHKNPDWKYRSFQELILDCGLTMKGKPRSSDIDLGRPKSCYYNCQQLVFSNEELIYVEGYALAHDLNIPLSHAWLMTKDGDAVDPTWETPGAAYFGVPLATAWVESFLRLRVRRDDLSIFDGNHLENYSLLKQGLPAEAVVAIAQTKY